MNAKQLFVLIDKIDKRFIDEAWGSSNDNEFYRDIDDYDSERRRGINVVIEHTPFRTFAPIVAAACMLLFVAGGFTAINIFRDELLRPGSGVENPASYIESSSSENSSLPQDTYSYFESRSSENLSIHDDVISDTEKYEYELTLDLGQGNEVVTKGMEKLNNLGYAEIMVVDTNATAEHPIIVQILRLTSEEDMEPISEKISIVGPGTYEIPYTTLRGAGSYSYLYLTYPNRDYDGTLSSGHIIGYWTP